MNERDWRTQLLSENITGYVSVEKENPPLNIFPVLLNFCEFTWYCLEKGKVHLCGPGSQSCCEKVQACLLYSSLCDIHCLASHASVQVHHLYVTIPHGVISLK